MMAQLRVQEPKADWGLLPSLSSLPLLFHYTHHVRACTPVTHDGPVPIASLIIVPIS